MPAIFPRWMNVIPTAAAVGAPLVAAGLVGVVWYWFSPSYTDVGYQPSQPVAFSHRLHAGEIGMDCRYCHSTVEVAGMAAVPPTATCMNCHKIVKMDSELLAPIRESAESGAAVEWTRVHMLPDYAYFDHSVHIAASVGCVECHGRIDQMDVVTQDQPLSMSWCLDCHRNPGPHLRPRDQVTNMAWDGSYDASSDPARTRDVEPPVHCSGCHR